MLSLSPNSRQVFQHAANQPPPCTTSSPILRHNRPADVESGIVCYSGPLLTNLCRHGYMSSNASPWFWVGHDSIVVKMGIVVFLHLCLRPSLGIVHTFSCARQLSLLLLIEHLYCTFFSLIHYQSWPLLSTKLPP
jgi:hypothetical protein